MTQFPKVLILAALLAMAPITAAQADNDIGCGVGTMIFEGSAGPMKILASITNNLTFQSISVTFGLLNCGGLDQSITASAKTRHFAATSIDNLARDAALGGGESLDALAALLEVPAADRPDFGLFAQSHYEALFPTSEVRSDEMLESLDRLMRADARFASSAPSAQL